MLKHCAFNQSYNCTRIKKYILSENTGAGDDNNQIQELQIVNVIVNYMIILFSSNNQKNVIVLTSPY